MHALTVEITLNEPMLGTTSGDKEVAKTYIASKNPSGVADDEIDAIDGMDVLEKSSTCFPKDAGDNPFMWDYQVKGFFKDACGMLKRAPGTKSSGVKVYKKIIDGLIFPFPRKIPFRLSGPLTWTERPLRAQTPKGERIALVRSETVPAGSILRFDIKYMQPKMREVILEWLEYGEFRGFGQWRNSGMGRFSFVLVGESNTGAISGESQ